MATIIQAPTSVSFLSNLEDVIFGSNADHAEVLVAVTYAGDTETIYDETLYPDAEGRIELAEMSELLEPYVRARLNVVMQATIKEYNASDVLQSQLSTTPCTVLFAMVDIGEEASEFVTKHFLTTLNGPKVTDIGCEERLYAYDVSSVTITAEYLSSNGGIVTKTGTLTPAGTSDSISAFFVSPDNILELLGSSWGSLVRYTVTAGNRSQVFDIERGARPVPSLAFINSFGCIEFLHCHGTHQKDSKYTRQSTRIRGQLRNYKVQEERNFKANTGWLTTDMADWADELFRSQEVYLWVDGQCGREVVITESTSIISNEDSDMPSFDFTYQYSQRLHNVMQRTHAGRIFDNTFDHTFN